MSSNDKKKPDANTARALVDLKEYKPLGTEIHSRHLERGRMVAPTNASEAMQFAALMSRSQAAVPEPFRNNPGLCLGVTMDAMTFGMNPFALAREAYDVSGVLAYQAKVYVAAINNSGFLKERLKFRFAGAIDGTQKIKTKKKEWYDTSSGKRAFKWVEEEKEAPGGSLTCTIIGHLLGEEEPSEWESIPLGMIQTKNSPLWYSDPKMQLFYYAARQWARVYLPEVMMGVVTRDEVDDNPDAFVDIPPERPTLIKRLQEKRAESAPSEEEPEQDEIIEAEVDEEAGDDEPEEQPAQATEEEAEEPEPEEAPQDGEGEEFYITDAIKILFERLQAITDQKECKPAAAAWLDEMREKFSPDDQIELQKQGDHMASRRKLDIGKMKLEQKSS